MTMSVMKDGLMILLHLDSSGVQETLASHPRHFAQTLTLSLPSFSFLLILPDHGMERKRKRDSPPLAVLYSTLSFRAANTCLAWSPSNILAYVPPKPTAVFEGNISVHQPLKRLRTTESADRTPNDQSGSKLSFALATAAGPSMDQPLRYATAVEQAQKYHKYHTITHLSWNQRGTCLASVDETGKVALWEMKQTVNDWACVKELDMEQPIVAFLWLNTHRQYIASAQLNLDDSTPSYMFDKCRGPRNPHGHLAFVAVTANGEIAVRYQHEGNIFSEMSTRLQRPPNVQADRCRISHASLILNDDGHIYLATHWATSTPKLVCLYDISIKFTGITPQGAIQCRPITRLRLSSPLHDHSLSMVSYASVLHVKLLVHDPKPRLVVVVAEEQEQIYVDPSSDGFTSALAVWDLTETSAQLRNDFAEPEPMQNDTFSTQPRPTMKFVAGHLIPDRLVTALSTTGGGRELVLGFSDGTVQLEYRDGSRYGVSKTQPPHDWTAVADNDCIGYDYWRPTRLENTETEYGYVVDIMPSPNEALLTFVTSSGEVFGVDITNAEKKPEQALIDIGPSLADNITQTLVLSLLNNVDCDDLISIVGKLSISMQRPDLPESILEQVVEEYSRIRNPDRGSTDQRIPQLPTLSDIRQTYGLMLSMFKIFSPRKRVQYANIYSAIQLHSIMEAILGSCITENGSVLARFESDGNSKGELLKFEDSAVWSLAPLAAWVISCAMRLLHGLHIHFNSRRRPRSDSKSKSVPSSDTIPTAAALVLHGATRECLRRCLILVQQLRRTVSAYSASAQIANLKTLQNHIENLFSALPISLDKMLAFLKEVGECVETVPEESVDASPSLIDQRLLIRALVPRRLEPKLRNLLTQHQSIFEPTQCSPDMKWLGIGESKRDAQVAKLDVVRKYDIDDASLLLRQCSRCFKFSGGSQRNDQTAKTAWYSSFDRTCVCGGFWTGVPK